MKKRNYLIGILISLLLTGLLFTTAIYWYGRLNGKNIEYRDLAAIFTAVIVSGSFIITTLNTKLNADLNEAKLAFDRSKFNNDKKIIAYPLELIIKLNADVNSSKSVTILLNHLELIAISYQEDIGDKALIRELFLNIFKGHYTQFDLYIKTKQKRYSSNFFDTFEAVAKEWNY